jgi:hypothetical protein
MEDKIDAYFLLTAMQSCGSHTLEEIGMCVYVLRFVDRPVSFDVLLYFILLMILIFLALLRLLGEDLPNEGLELLQIISAVIETKQLFERESDESLLRMTKIHNNTKKIENIMKFYGHLGLISWFSAPNMHAFYMARFAQFCLKSRVGCKYLPSAFCVFGACLCNGLTNETWLGTGLGR